MEKKSRLRKIILIVLGVNLACSVLCLVPFFLLGGMALLSPKQITVSTVVANQPPAEKQSTLLVGELLTETTPAPTAIPPVGFASVTPLPPTATPDLPADAACIPANPRERALVVQALDGARLQVVMREQTYIVRYLGVRAPDFGLKSQPFGPEAAIFNKSLTQNQVITMVQDVTEYNDAHELLRYVVVNNRFVNLELARQGLAEALPTAPDGSCDAIFAQAQQQAQQDRVGLWKDYQPTATPGPLSTLDLSASPTPAVAAGPCECQGADLDCADFATRAEAQACYDYCKSQGFGDIFLIDIDQDGIACINKRP